MIIIITFLAEFTNETEMDQPVVLHILSSYAH